MRLLLRVSLALFAFAASASSADARAKATPFPGLPAPAPAMTATAKPLPTLAPGELPTPVPERNDARRSVRDRNDYANGRFNASLNAGLQHFYTRNFKEAQSDFENALKVVPDNTLAISFLNAAAAHSAGALDVLTNLEEDAVTGAPKNYVNRVRLAFSYLFQSVSGRDRAQDAREELNAAHALDANGQAAHVGLGIMRFNERSANRAKTEFLAALKVDPNNVLAREYLGELYQIDLRDPQRGLAYVIDVPNIVPNYADIHFHIGSLLHDLRQPNEAIKYITTGLEIDTSHVGEAGQHGLTLLGRVYIEQHKLEDAKRVLSAAVKYNADAIYAKKLLDKIAKGDYDAKSVVK